MRFLAFLSLGTLGAAVGYLSKDGFADVHGLDLVDPIASLAILELILAVIPFALFWQWYGLASENQSIDLSRVRDRYYLATVSIIALGILALWYGFPYRLIVSAADQGPIPVFDSRAEMVAFNDAVQDWIEEAGNWPWLIFPLTVIAIPYARIVTNVASFGRRRGQESATIHRTGLLGALTSISIFLERSIDYAISATAQAVRTLNAVASDAIKESFRLLLNLSALALLLGIGLVILVPGIIIGSPFLIAGGAIVEGLLILGMIAGGRQDRPSRDHHDATGGESPSQNPPA